MAEKKKTGLGLFTQTLSGRIHSHIDCLCHHRDDDFLHLDFGGITIPKFKRYRGRESERSEHGFVKGIEEPLWISWESRSFGTRPCPLLTRWKFLSNRIPG